MSEAGVESPKEAEARTERKYDISALTSQVRGALKADYKRDVNEFIMGLKSALKDLTPADEEQAKQIYQTEQETVKELDWLARREYFKL